MAQKSTSDILIGAALIMIFCAGVLLYVKRNSPASIEAKDKTTAENNNGSNSAQVESASQPQSIPAATNDSVNVMNEPAIEPQGTTTEEKIETVEKKTEILDPVYEDKE